MCEDCESVKILPHTKNTIEDIAELTNKDPCEVVDDAVTLLLIEDVERINDRCRKKGVSTRDSNED